MTDQTVLGIDIKNGFELKNIPADVSFAYARARDGIKDDQSLNEFRTFLSGSKYYWGLYNEFEMFSIDNNSPTMQASDFATICLQGSGNLIPALKIFPNHSPYPAEMLIWLEQFMVEYMRITKYAEIMIETSPAVMRWMTDRASLDQGSAHSLALLMEMPLWLISWTGTSLANPFNKIPVLHQYDDAGLDAFYGTMAQFEEWVKNGVIAEPTTPTTPPSSTPITGWTDAQKIKFFDDLHKFLH